MRRLILTEAPGTSGILNLGSREYRYLVRVLRLEAGDHFRALLPNGTETLFKIIEIGKTSLKAAIIDELGVIPDSARADQKRREILPPVPPIILCQALPKGQKMDLIVRQATEAGVSHIIPFVSQHSVPRLDMTASQQKLERWNRIIKEARQQSGSDVETQIHPITDMAGMFVFWNTLQQKTLNCRALLLHQDPLAKGTLHGYLEGSVESVLIAVGPEGGFSEDEANQCIAQGFKPLLLGMNVLRTETAAIFATAAVQVLLLEKASWNLLNI
ncbi:RsmE family RNA methyltransferase [Gracilinema caldarium]|uniref:Ribosomal RNA small subunit methyltransferase E n=1 Tax=Gracilinema caldarium (strain ATCC 51460 / DSM 7334 / H1) TaxID=744872 RepID=F8EYH4_GRAC1|nr:RsmE family RNA methyltransferase [Gracilinema caldarium]AEJ18406.1 Ribosomal RNA small subunit methyltransferase E [Gracilinema caldarium DSM 7334]